MSLTPEQAIRSKYQDQIKRNKQFEVAIDENLSYFQRGLYSPQEFVRSLSLTGTEAEAFVVTPTPDGRYPVSNILIVRTVPFTPYANKIEVHDPFHSPEYTQIELAGDPDTLYPAKIIKHESRGKRLITELDGYDYQTGVGIANWFGISRILDQT
jgi:hypothetical protein